MRGKLSDEQVDAIRRRYAEGESMLHLAVVFRVSEPYVRLLRRGVSRGPNPYPYVRPEFHEAHAPANVRVQAVFDLSAPVLGQQVLIDGELFEVAAVMA